jgi:quinol monooxygenase YgiN
MVTSNLGFRIMSIYCVVYEFFVEQQHEEEFKKLWHELTVRILKESGSMGSRLHKVSEPENTWVAYAQWPSKQVYENTPEKVSYEDIRERFLNTCAGIRIAYQMECIDNLFT